MAILTTLEELYKFGPGPSSSHTMGPMIAGYNFYQLACSLSLEELSQATDLKIELLGSLSATGKGHGTDRAVLAGVLGKTPDNCDPRFLDELAEDRYKKHTLDIKSFRTHLSVDDVIYGPTVGKFPHPNTMRLALYAEDKVLLQREYYSVGGGFIEWKGYQPPPKADPPYPYDTFKELKSYVTEDFTLFDILLANEIALSGKTESEILAFIGKVISVMQRSSLAGLQQTDKLPGTLGLQSKAHRLYELYKASEPSADRSISGIASMAIAASEENARGHIICTAPTAGSAGVMAGAVNILLMNDMYNFHRICEGLVVAAAIGYLCKHNATLSGAEGGCQAEIGVASAMTAAMLVHYKGGNAELIDNAAESALEHHLGLTCDPVGGYVQIPCIERNGFGIIKAWTASCIALDEMPGSHMVSFDDCVEAMYLTAQAMSSKYKETSEGGLAKVLC